MTRAGRGDQSDDASPASLTSLCELARWSHGAAAVSIAVVTDDGLQYVAASGAGASEIVGTSLRAGEGLAGFVGATGQSLAVRDVVSDPRFARNVADRTGYVPDAIQITPIVDHIGEVVGVMSMLDRGHHGGAPHDPPFGLSGFAEIAGALVAAHPTALDMATTHNDVLDRIARLGTSDRSAVITAVSAVLDALER